MELEEKLTLAGPEGIDLDLVLAGIGTRGAALFVDGLIQFATLVAITFVAGTLQTGGIALLSVGFFLVVFGYPTIAEAYAGGQTVGKKALGIAVVRTDGTPVGFLGAAARNVVRLIDLLPGTYTVGLIAVFVSKRNQRLGDMVANTLVVRRAREQLPLALPGSFDPIWGVLPPEPPPTIASWDTSAVTADELAAVRAFLTRRHQLDLVHRAQLAERLAGQVLPKVAGIPLDGGPEPFLERVAYARAFR